MLRKQYSLLAADLQKLELQIVFHLCHFVLSCQSLCTSLGLDLQYIVEGLNQLLIIIRRNRVVNNVLYISTDVFPVDGVFRRRDHSKIGWLYYSEEGKKLQAPR